MTARGASVVALPQGFLLSRPLPAKECRCFLGSGGHPEFVLRAAA